MSFDVVVGNPPYQGNQSAGNKTHSLWKKFIKKSTNLLYNNGCLIFVVPSTWIGDKKTYKLFIRGYLSYAKLLSKKVFNQTVGVDVSYFMWHNTKSNKNTNLELQCGDIIDFNINNTDMPTSIIDRKSISIHRKIISQQSLTTNQSSIYYAHKSYSELNKYPIYNTTAQGLCWSDRKPGDLSYKKVLFSNCGTYKTVFDDGTMGTCWHSHSIIVKNKEEADCLISYLNSKIIKFFNKINRTGGFMNETFPYHIPKIDLSKTWTDQELYQHFNLTQEEIDYIEESLK